MSERLSEFYLTIRSFFVTFPATRSISIKTSEYADFGREPGPESGVICRFGRASQMYSERARLSREIDEELESHIAEAIEQGRDPAEARRAFGSALRAARRAATSGWPRGSIRCAPTRFRLAAD